MSHATDLIRILSVDDHPLLRSGIGTLIATQTDMPLVGEASTGREAVRLHRELNPDVTLMDLQMPDMSGLDTITAIRTEDPTARIIVLTTYSSDALAQRAPKAGAQAYVLKSLVRTEILNTIRVVHEERGAFKPTSPPRLRNTRRTHAVSLGLKRGIISL